MTNLNKLDLEINLENVERVVIEFYTSSQLTNEYKPKLDEWLKEAQCSKEAWSFSWDLIDMNKSVNCQFYGASCLYLKVSKYLNDVPAEEYDVLKNKLLEKLLLYAVNLNKHEQIRLIQRKLNSTLAKLAIYLINDQWQNCIYDIIQTIPNCLASNQAPKETSQNLNTSIEEFNNINKLQLILIVIDRLTLLPEEYSTLNNINTLNKFKRTQIHSQLKKSFHLISHYLINLFNQFNQFFSNQQQAAGLNQLQQLQFKIVENSVKCLTSWIDFGIQFDEISSFLDYLFGYIYNDQLFEQSAECLTSLFSNEENLK